MGLCQDKQGCGLAGTETLQQSMHQGNPCSRESLTSLQPISPTQGALGQGKTSLLESPRLLTRWGISFLEPGIVVQTHQIFRFHVCGWAKGKLCLMPELYPPVMERASALSPWGPCVGWENPASSHVLGKEGENQQVF